MRHDFSNLPDGSRILLYPRDTNPLHKKPVNATFQGGYYYCDGTPHIEGPDYYWRDVSGYMMGYEFLPKGQ